MKSTAIVLVSGGMDSLVTAAIAAKEHEPAFLHVNYGQRTEKRELKAFNEIAVHFRVKQKLIVDITYLAQIGGSSLRILKLTKQTSIFRAYPLHTCRSGMRTCSQLLSAGQK